MVAISTKETENGSGIPAVQSKGTQPADNNVSNSENINVCPHRYAGCISQNGYMCTLGAPCNPCDDKGRNFQVSYSEVDGQRLMVKTYSAKPLSIIDADTLQAAKVMQGSESAIAGTPFADRTPFDAGKRVTDLVGS
jgi:hypothetical protein